MIWRSAIVCLLLSGCSLQGDIAGNMVAQDTAKCRATGAVADPEFTDCMNRMMAYRQQVSDEVHAFGQRLRNAGTALQQAGAPPRGPITCTTTGNTTTCN